MSRWRRGTFGKVAIDVEDERGQTTLQWAACADVEVSLAYVKTLVEFRCDVNSMDILGQTALDCVLQPAISSRTRPSGEITRFLLGAGLDISKGRHSQTTDLLETPIRDRDPEIGRYVDRLWH